MTDGAEIDLDARLALVLLRASTFLDQKDFAEIAGIARTQLGVYERAERSVPGHVLERAADAAGCPRALLSILIQGEGPQGLYHAERDSLQGTGRLGPESDGPPRASSL